MVQEAANFQRSSYAKHRRSLTLYRRSVGTPISLTFVSFECHWSLPFNNDFKETICWLSQTKEERLFPRVKVKNSQMITF